MFMGLDAEKYDRQYTDRYLFSRLWDYLKPQLLRLTGTSVMGLVASLLTALLPILISDGIDALESEGISNRITLLLIALFVSAVLQYVTNWARRLWMTELVGDVISEMRKDSMTAAVERDMAFYDETKSGKVLSRITSDTEELGQVLTFSSDLVTQVVQAVILIAVLFRRNVTLTLIMLAFVPIVIGLAMLLRRMARKATRQGSRVMAEVNDNIQESVTGISVAKNFRRERLVYTQFTEINTRSYRINLNRGFVFTIVWPLLNMMSGAATGAVVFLGAQRVVGGIISVSAWYLFILSMDRFWFPFLNIAAYWNQFQQALSDLERIMALIDAGNTVQQADSQPAGDLEGGIEFRDVTFAYKQGLNVLKDFSLSIQPGENIAFVGHTGAGKSTIAKLVTRFYEFQQGTILVDGRDIRSFDLTDYRSRLGLVPQSPFLFSGTIVDNIRYGRPDATDEEIFELAQSIGNGEWMETLPEGLMTDAGERGARLSMGQRQLVSLLRVMVQKPAIFILDEATASIDPFTEMQIQEAIEMVLAQSTSILIAHRLSTVRSADRIIVLADGTIIEEGSHDSLMAQDGHYAELYNTYFRHQSLSYVETSRMLLSEN